MGRESRRAPTYDLEEVKDLVREGRWEITKSAEKCAINRDLTVENVADVVLDLDPAAFERTMESETMPGSYQDEYRHRAGDDDWFIKVQVLESEDGTRKARVVSFRPWSVH